MDAIEGTDGSHFYVKYDYTSLSEEESKAAGIDDVCTGQLIHPPIVLHLPQPNPALHPSDL